MKVKDMPMNVQVSLNNVFTKDRSDEELQRVIKEGVAIRDYLDAKISIGELAEILGMGYMEARDWLHAKGIATTRKLPPDLQKAVHNNMKRLSKRLGKKLGV